MAIADLIKADFQSLNKIVRKLNSLPDDADSLKILNAIGAELHGWIARHNDPEGAEVLAAIIPRLSLEAQTLPQLLNEFRQVLAKNDAVAADYTVGGLKFSLLDALEGLREFMLAKGIDPAQYELPVIEEAPAEVIPSDELLETTAVEGADAPVETAIDPDLETNAVASDPAPAEPTASAGYKCEFCGYQYQSPPGKFCDNCGHVLARLNLEKEDDIYLKKCMKCGLRNQPEERLCKNCGELLREPGL